MLDTFTSVFCLPVNGDVISCHADLPEFNDGRRRQSALHMFNFHLRICQPATLTRLRTKIISYFIVIIIKLLDNK